MQVPPCPPISRRLASEGIADPSDLRSLSLPGASPGAPTGVWFTGNSRPGRLKPDQPWECKSPHADHFWNANRTSGPGLGANECVPPGMWRKSTAFRHFRARSSRRTVRLISGIALDECRVPERYRTRVPFQTPEREVDRAVPPRGMRAGGRDRPGVFSIANCRLPIAELWVRDLVVQIDNWQSAVGDTLRVWFNSRIRLCQG